MCTIACYVFVCEHVLDGMSLCPADNEAAAAVPALTTDDAPAAESIYNVT